MGKEIVFFWYVFSCIHFKVYIVTLFMFSKVSHVYYQKIQIWAKFFYPLTQAHFEMHAFFYINVSQNSFHMSL